MTIQVDQQMREDIKKNKLRQLMARYIELELDKIAHQANGLDDNVAFVEGEMEKVRKGYEAIQNA